jgi:hypothetical protein
VHTEVCVKKAFDTADIVGGGDITTVEPVVYSGAAITSGLPTIQKLSHRHTHCKASQPAVALMLYTQQPDGESVGPKFCL